MKPVAEWDYEGLQLGKPRTKGEGFDGPAPKWITGQVREEIRRRLAQGVRADMAQHAQAAVAVMVELAKNKNEDSRVRADAAKFVIDHLAGKATVSLEVDSTDRLHQFLAGALVLPGGQPAHPIMMIDGEVVPDAREPDDDLEGEEPQARYDPPPLPPVHPLPFKKRKADDASRRHLR